MNNRRLALVVKGLAMLSVVTATAGLREQSRTSAQDSDRFVIHDGKLAISRPNESWKFEMDASEPPVVAGMQSPDEKARADVQVQEVPGVTLDGVKGMIEQAIALQVKDFKKLSEAKVKVGAVEAYKLAYSATQDGAPRRAEMLVCKPGNTLYVVKCIAPANEWSRFKKDFDSVLASFEILSDERKVAPTKPAASQVSVQYRRYDQDPSLNNLVHRKGYKTCKLGDLGRVTKVGNGKQDMILIAGAGFGGDVFDGFMKSRTGEYTMYAVTLPGFGGTAAPPMPPAGTSYGQRTWTQAARKGVERLISEKKMKRPIVVGHWQTASLVALELALNNPDKIGAVIIISGVAKNATADKQVGRALTLKERADYIDQRMAPGWFKTVTRDTWDDNNYYPHDYARHPVRALQLWRQAYAATLPVWVRYLCENWAQDITLELDKLSVPTLILKPGFDEGMFVTPGRDYMRSYCHDSWKGVEQMSKLITIQTIEDSRVFIMDDQPEELDQAIAAFLKKLETGNSE